MSSTPRDWNSEAESSVLGSILLDPACLAEISLIVKSWDFYSPANRLVFDALVDMSARGVGVDVVTLHDEFERRGALAKVGGPEYLADLMAFVPSPANAEHYAAIVRAHARTRRAKEKLGDALKSLNDGAESVDEVLARFGNELKDQVPSFRDEVVDTRVSRLARGEVTWLWPAYVPAGTLTLVCGEGGLGKGTLLCDIAARVSNASPMPDGSFGACTSPRDVLWLTAEDDPTAVLKPRLEAAGADLDRIHLVRVRRDGIEGELTLDSGGLATLKERIAMWTAALAVFDPIGCYLPAGIDEHRDGELRRVLGPLTRIAETTGCAVVGVKHLNKNQGANGVNRISGSSAWGNAARSVLAVGLDPDDLAEDERAKRRVLAVVKLNVGVPGCSHGFRLASSPGDAGGLAHVAWLGPSECSAGKLLCGQLNEEEHEERDAAVEFLREKLADGAEVSTRDIETEARKRGVSQMTLRRARKVLGVKPRKTATGWVLYLPKQP